MSDNSDVNDLFKVIRCEAGSPNEIANFLESYGNRHLKYPGDGNRNIGYIFRGEIDFPVPLQSSLEREWFSVNSGDECAATELLSFERNLLTEFMRDAPLIRGLAKEHQDQRPELPHDQSVFEWLQLKQHYRTKTRFLDFTRRISIALYFALEHYCQKCSKRDWKQNLTIYCFPCVDRCNDGDDNKSPFRITDGEPNMDLAIGGQMGLDCMKPHSETFGQRYCPAKQKQSFGWDCAHQTNPRLSFQEGMLAYPYEIDGVTVERNKPSWFVRCLRMNPSDPFHLGPAKDGLPPLMIRIPEKSVGHILEYVQNVCSLTPAKVYLDYGRIGDCLRPSRS